MSRFDPTERRNEDLLGAIHEATTRIVHAINQGFKLMADTEAAAIADLATAVQNIADAVAGEIAALQAAVTAAQAQLPPDHSAAIQEAVTRLNDLTAALKSSVAPATPASSTSASAPASTPAAPTTSAT